MEGGLVDFPAMRRTLAIVGVCAVFAAGLAGAQPPDPTVETTSLLGQPLRPPSPLPNREALDADLVAARSVADPTTADAAIWIGRRLGYLWRYREAIEAFSSGIARHPTDARLYRHRGHRYITVRQFARAESDLARAAELMASRPDEIEPDGQPNAAGRPRSTLHFNVWYHLGLARYLQGNFAGALDAYRRCLEVSTNDDALVATSDWLWMTLMRLNRPDQAAVVLDRITPTMEILENGSYHRRLLMYKGLATPASLLDIADGDATTIATQGYGVGNYYLVRGEVERAREIFTRVVAGSGWNAFGFIAAEVELAGR
jgi:tetratricopeptide (TPR) repeat protein